VRFWRPWEDGVRNISASTPVTPSVVDENQENVPPKTLRRGSLSVQFQQAIIDLYQYNVAQGSPRPVQDVSRALKLHHSNVRRVLARGAREPKKRGPRPRTSQTDTFQIDVIRRIIEQKYSTEVPPLDSLLHDVKNTIPGSNLNRRNLNTLLRKMGLR